MAKQNKPGDPIPIGSADAKRTRKKSMSVRDIRRRRGRRALLRFAIWVGLPTTIAIVYYGFLASPQYESTAVFSVQSSKDSPGNLNSIAAAFMPAASSTRDAKLVIEYVKSRDMLKYLDEHHQLSKHYQSTSSDWWSRLSSDASPEAKHEYYREAVKLRFSNGSGTITLKVRAYDPQTAQAVSQGIIKAAEIMVNRLSDRARQDRLKVSNLAVAETETRLAAARKKLIALQGDHVVLDPRAKATAVASITTSLESQLAQERATLSSLLAVMQPTAPKVVQQRHRVNALAGQLAAQRRRLLGTGNRKGKGKGTSVKTSFASFEPALLEKELAQRSYEAALKTLQLARFEAAKQHRYLVTISEPSLPGSPTYPRRFWSILTVFIVSLLLMGVFTLLWASIREHANF